MIRSHAKPVVVISRCLCGEKCRYDGRIITCKFIEKIKPLVDLRTVCPETDIKLGIPRPVIRLEMISGEVNIIQQSTGRNLTPSMNKFARQFMKSLGKVNGFILKSGSPSCAVCDAKIYLPGQNHAYETGPGLFTRAVIEHFSGTAITDEKYLESKTCQKNFLKALFTY